MQRYMETVGHLESYGWKKGHVTVPDPAWVKMTKDGSSLDVYDDGSILDTVNGIEYKNIGEFAHKVSALIDIKPDNKTDITTLPPNALTAIAKVMMYGQKKYPERNFLLSRPGETKEQHIRRYVAAAFRHTFQWLDAKFWTKLDSGYNDAESGLSHLHHAAANLLMATEIELAGGV